MKWFYGLVFFLISSALSHADETALVRIDIAGLSDQEVRQLAAMNLDITSLQRAQGRMEAILTSEQQRAVAARGIPFQAIIPDMSAYAQRLRDGNYFSYFHSNEQILQRLQAAAADYPHIAALHDIGDSYLKTVGRGGHDIWALKISDEVAREDSTEADVLYMANMHAREIITPEILLFFMHYLLDHYGADPYVTHLVDHRELWLIPTFNPDGHEYVFTGNVTYRDYPGVTDPLWWRKNMRDNDADGQFSPFYDGVDLNRNFGFAWGADDEGSSPRFQDVTYRGAAAFSEPESQTIRDFVLKQQFIASLCYHSYGNLWLYPWGYTFESLPEPDVTVFRALADSCVAYNRYAPGPSATLYLVNGDTDDWLYGDQGVWAFTAEVGDGARDHYFFPDTNRILPLMLENLGPNLFLAYAAGEEPIVAHTAPADTIQQNEDFKITATISHPIVLTDSVGLDSSSFRLYYRQADTHFTALPLSYDDSLRLFTSAIPGKGLYGLIHYYVEARDLSGRRGASPRAAPLAVDSFYVAFATNQIGPRNEMARSFQLGQNYPNPFNSTTRITFHLPKTDPASVDIYDVSGRFVLNLAQGILDAGPHVAVWDGRDAAGSAVASGIYYCRLQAPRLQKSIKMVLLR